MVNHLLLKMKLPLQSFQHDPYVQYDDHIIIDNHRHIFNINTTTDHVSCNQDIFLTPFKTCQSKLSLFLSFTTMKCTCVILKQNFSRPLANTSAPFFWLTNIIIGGSTLRLRISTSLLRLSFSLIMWTICSVRSTVVNVFHPFNFYLPVYIFFWNNNLLTIWTHLQHLHYLVSNWSLACTPKSFAHLVQNPCLSSYQLHLTLYMCIDSKLNICFPEHQSNDPVDKLITSHPNRNLNPCSSLDKPPTTTTVLIPNGCPNFKVSSSIC
ncbi:hypothetical protein AGLY_010392 [Aphis glycines]|uniref:Uncharacterized protein n=1 Tax=Aphis glycines TaxID=307491 RepID=A0A6G0TI42_APHGL|nr:hypothetical protein AGLY_010392 [Aphis glycines]